MREDKMASRQSHVAGFVLSLILVFGLGLLLVGNRDTRDRVIQVSHGNDNRERDVLQGYHARHVTKGCAPKLDKAKYYSQFKEDRALFLNYFNSPTICNGVYVEIGALDGITFSNSKFFEDYLNWTGVLIEAQPGNAKKLQKNRNARRNVIIPEAVCQEGQHSVNFSVNPSPVAGIPKEMTNKHIRVFFGGQQPPTVAVPCRPIGTMLRKAGITAVDFFILDVEGAELMVLQTMDWAIPVKVFVVEMGRGQQKDKALTDLMISRGYRKSIWNIAGYCPHYAYPCKDNQVFEHANYTY